MDDVAAPSDQGVPAAKQELDGNHPAADPAAATDFLRRLRSGPHTLAAISPDRGGPVCETFSVADADAMREWISVRVERANLYFHVATLRGHPANGKAAKEDVASVEWLWVDLDPRAGEDRDAERARILESLTTKLPPGVPAPTCIIDSGNGYQALWRLAEPYIIDGAKERWEEFERYNRQLELIFGGDHCHNCERILRVPFTANLPDAKKRKKGRVPAPARVVEHSDTTHPLSAFTPAAPPAGALVQINTAATTRLGSLDELDKYGVPDRVKVVIVQGCDPDNPKPGDNSRSAWCYDVACNLVRCNVPDDVIFSVLTDPNLRISDSVRDKGRNAERYALRQIARAKAEVATGPLVLHPDSPVESAQQFVLRRRPTLMHHNDDWLAHDGAAYVELENATIRSELYAFLHGAQTPTKDGEPRPFNPTKTKVANVLDALAAEAHRERERFAPPCWLGVTGPPPREIVACRNGLLHLPTGELLPASERFFTRNALEFDHEPAAPTPTRWLQFLAEVWLGEADTVATLQELFGYLLIPDTSQQKIFMLVGPTRSGKGTIANVLQRLVGRHNCCAPTLKSLADPFGLEPLIGKQLAIVSDLRLGRMTDHAAVAENLLRISGEDMVTANRKYKRAWDGQLAVRFLVMTNEMPRFADASGALANRFVPLVMRQSFLGREDRALLGRLLPERAGILNWSVEGWRRLQARGHFEPPASSEEAVLQLMDLASPEAAFIREECEVLAQAVTPKAELFAAWQRWCNGRGDVFPGTLEHFSSRLQAAANGRVRATKARAGAKRVPSFAGIRPRQEASPDAQLPF